MDSMLCKLSIFKRTTLLTYHLNYPMRQYYLKIILPKYHTTLIPYYRSRYTILPFHATLIARYPYIVLPYHTTLLSFYSTNSIPYNLNAPLVHISGYHLIIILPQCHYLIISIPLYTIPKYVKPMPLFIVPLT